jgi:hypothetical protein
MNKLVTISLFIAFLSALQIIMMKKANENYSTQTIVSIYASIYFVMSLAYMAYHRSTIANELSEITMPVIFLVGAAAALSFLGNVLYNDLLSEHHASIVTTLISTAPIFLLFMMRDSLTYRSIIGVFAVIFGISMFS